MAEDTTREFLQPALLDRLTDDARTVTVFDVKTTLAELTRRELTVGMLQSALLASGLRALQADSDPDAKATQVSLQFWAPGRTIGLAQVKSLSVRSTGSHRSAELASFCEVTGASRPNQLANGAARRGISMRRLRESVLRDLSSLLNAINLEATVNLEAYPLVAASVLNFGLPNLAGLTQGSLAPLRMAERVQRAIEHFEPRLSRVRVTHEPDAAVDGLGGLAFRIEAELWGDPLPQQVAVRTRIDLGSGNARIDDLGGG